MITIKPTPTQILIKERVNKGETISDSGIIRKSTASDILSEEGEVVAVGTDVSDIKPGDLVLFKSYSLTEVHVDETTKYYFIDQGLILGTINYAQ